MACRVCKSNLREFFKFKNIPLSGIFLSNYDNQDKINSIRLKVNELMNNHEMFAY